MRAGDEGDGLPWSVKEAMSAAVMLFETGAICHCDKNEMNKIMSYVESRSVWTFSASCDATGQVYPLAYVQDGLWLSMRPKNCWYVIFSAY